MLDTSTQRLTIILLYALFIVVGCDESALKPDTVFTTKPAHPSNAVGIDENDNVPPSVSIRPASQAYIAPQTIVITATANDEAGVHKVRFYDNGSYKSTDYSTPYTHNWPISIDDNGSHLWRAIAYDTSGNSNAASVELGVDIAPPTDNEAPSVSISPATGMTYRSTQTVTISAVASDNEEIVRVEFYYDGNLITSDTSSPYATEWPVSVSDNGSHTWHAVTYDTGGNISTDVAILDVDIELPSGTVASVETMALEDTEALEDTQAPSVTIWPGKSQTYTKFRDIKISAMVRDDGKIDRVEFYYDGRLVKSDTSKPYVARWPLSTDDNGSHTWQAIAYDTAGNSSTDRVDLFVDIDSDTKIMN